MKHFVELTLITLVEVSLMGWWKKTFTVLQDVTTLGGSYRIRAGKDRYQELREAYERIHARVSHCNAELISAVMRIKEQVEISKRRLKSAQRILTPLGNRTANESGAAVSAAGSSLILRNSSPLTRSSAVDTMDDYLPILAGGGAGAAAAAGSWGIAQILAHASTGTAMAGLHGAAAANAGWAWFGGGSLAAGGGGMAAGHLVLPGIGTVIAVAVSSTMAHSKANEIAQACEELEGANGKNSLVLSRVEAENSNAKRLEEKLKSEDLFLAAVVESARRELFRFGFLSHWARLLRFWIRGYYYSASELPTIRRVESAVARFVSAF